MPLGRGLKLSLRALLRGARGVLALALDVGCDVRAGIRAGARSGGAADVELPKTLATGFPYQLLPPAPAKAPLLAVVMLDVVLTLRIPADELVAERETLPGRGRLHAIPPAAAGVAREIPVRAVCAVPGVARTAIRGLTDEGAVVDGVGGTLRLTVEPTTEPDEDEVADGILPRAEGVAEEAAVRERCEAENRRASESVTGAS